MAKINVIGKALVVTSDIKMKDLQKIEKYRPESLVLKGGEDGKEPIFVISTGRCGSISQFGVTFDGASRDEQGYATITMTVDCDDGNIKDFITDKFGGAIVKLNKLEDTLAGTIQEIDAEVSAAESCITIA